MDKCTMCDDGNLYLKSYYIDKRGLRRRYRLCDKCGHHDTKIEVPIADFKYLLKKYQELSKIVDFVQGLGE